MSDPLANIPDVPSVDAVKAKELVDDKNYALLDVRTVEEYERGHVAGSVNVPYLFFKQDGTKEVSMGLCYTITWSSLYQVLQHSIDCFAASPSPGLLPVYVRKQQRGLP